MIQRSFSISNRSRQEPLTWSDVVDLHRHHEILWSDKTVNLVPRHEIIGDASNNDSRSSPETCGPWLLSPGIAEEVVEAHSTPCMFHCLSVQLEGDMMYVKVESSSPSLSQPYFSLRLNLSSRIRECNFIARSVVSPSPCVVRSDDWSLDPSTI
jgi:hypothetical protein